MVGGGCVWKGGKRKRGGGGGCRPQSAFTKPADLTFVQPGPAVRCQPLLCDWGSCAVDLGGSLASSDWLLVAPTASWPSRRGAAGGGGVNVSSRIAVTEPHYNSETIRSQQEHFTARIRRLFTHTPTGLSH